MAAPAPAVEPGSGQEVAPAADGADPGSSVAPPPVQAVVQSLNKGLMIGTWAPDPELGFDKQWIDEEGLREVSTRTRANRRIWTGFTSGDVVVPLDSLLDDREGPAIGYVFSLSSRALGSDFEDRPALLHVRHRGRVRVRWDGLVVLDAPATTGGGSSEARVPVLLTGPYDVLLVKAGRGSAELGAAMDISVRVTAPDGSAIPSHGWNSMRPGGLPSDLEPLR